MALYIDIGIGAIILISLIVGIVKGFSKQFTKGLCGFVSLFGSIALTILLMPYIQKLSLFGSFSEVASGWFNKECYTTAITSMEDLNAALDGSVILRILKSLADRIFNRMQECEMATLGAYFGDMTARLIVGFVLWILLLLIIKLIFFGIGKLLQKLSKLPVLHTLDKVFGGLWSVGITYLIIISLLLTVFETAILKWIPGIQEQFATVIQDSYVLKYLHDTNVIGSYFAQMMGVNLLDIVPAA